MIAIHQFVPTVTLRDGIGHHALELRGVIRGMDVASDIFAVEIHGLEHEVRPYQEFVGGEGPTALLYQAATTSVLAEFLLQRPEPKIVDYQNITPARFFVGWDPGHAVAVRDARREIAALVRSADLVFTHSRFSARDIEDWGGPHPIIAPVLGASFLAPSEPDDRAPAATRQPRGDRSAQWLFVGRLAPNKAQEQLIKALAIFRRTYRLPAELHLVGSPTPPAYRDALAQLAASAGVGDAVHFHEGVPADDLSAMYRTADVFVSATAHEGFCVPVIEAMRFGLPVVARAAAAVPETAGGAAVLVPGDSASTLAVAVHRVLADPALADRLAAAGRARAAALMDQEHNEYRDALRALLDKLT